MRHTPLKLTLAFLPVGLGLCAGVGAQENANYTDFSVSVPSQYFYRGIRQSDSGFIFQPALRIGGLAVPGSGGDSALGDIDWQIGLRNSLHEGPTGTANGSAWYEADFHLGAIADIGKQFQLEARWGVRHSPNGRFRTVQELMVRFDWNDGGEDPPQPGSFGGLHPHATIARELSHGSDAGQSHGTYLELGIEPSYQLTEKVGLKWPVTIGLSLEDYYELSTGDDDVFGFLSAGMHATMPMDFLPTRFGPWQLKAGIDLLFLGDNTEVFNNNDSFELLASIGAEVRW